MTIGRLARFIIGVMPALALAIPLAAMGGPPGSCTPWPSCRNDDGGGDTSGDGPQIVAVGGHSGIPAAATLYAPSDADPNCVAQKGSGKSLSAVFPRHDLCATLTTTTAATIADDIVILVDTNKAGQPTGITVRGQDTIGEEGIAHTSETVIPASTETNSDGNMVIHVHADNVTLYKCDAHLIKRRTVCDQDVGSFALHDLVYIPDP